MKKHFLGILGATVRMVFSIALLAVPAFAASVSGYVTLNGSGFHPDASKIYVKLVSGGAVSQVVEPNTITGAFTFTGVTSGTYTVVLSANNSVADPTAVSPALYAFYLPSTGTRSVSVGAANVVGVNFSLDYQCRCSYEDGRLTEKTIPMTANGDLTAWGEVMADGDNNSCDSTVPDRDAPIQSTGRDLLQFSYTYDSTRLYGFTTRVASDSNTDNFIYYADTNNNGIMQLNEPVIYVGWQGNNRTVTVGVGRYVPRNSAGDPLNNPSTGYADGFGMPGTIQNGVIVRSASWGSNSGVAMQWYVTWAELGIAPRTAIRWHISSTNATPTAASLPNQIDDNLGGCGGCAASNQYSGVTVTGANTASTAPGGTVYLPGTITNAGNASDTFEFATTASGPWTPSSVTYYADNDASGTFTAGDTLLTNSGVLTAGGSKNILVAVTTPASPAGTDTVTFRATSTFIPACGTGTIASASVDHTVLSGWILSGYVFADGDHSGTLDAGENGTSQTVYVKLLSESNALLASTTADVATGAYSFPPQLSATYRVVISNSATGTASSYPPGWVPTTPAAGSQTAVISGANVGGVSFGLYNGSSINSGIVFRDVGGPYPPAAALATANNGAQDNTTAEPGVPGSAVTVTNLAGTITYDTATTDANGGFTLYVPASTTGTSVVVRNAPVAALLPTGGSVGTTLGTYARGSTAAASTVTFTNTVGTLYSGITFGLVPVNAFSTDNTATVQAGSSAYHPHRFTAGTIGNVTFNVSVGSGGTGTWTEAILHDVNCNGVFDSAADITISGAQSLTAPGDFCILLRENPAVGASGTNGVSVSAVFTYANASPVLVAAPLVRQDTTIAALPPSITLVKFADKQRAYPGDVVTYTISYTNTGDFEVSNVVLSDVIPVHTGFVEATCGPLPDGVTACAITSPAVGDDGVVNWTLAGTLGTGKTGVVTLRLTVE